MYVSENNKKLKRNSLIFLKLLSVLINFGLHFHSTSFMETPNSSMKIN